MTEEFYRHIFDKQQSADAVPSNREISTWAKELLRILFPEHSKAAISSLDDLKKEFRKLEIKLIEILQATKACLHCDNEKVAKDFFASIPEIYDLLRTDIKAIFMGDPAARTESTFRWSSPPSSRNG